MAGPGECQVSGRVQASLTEADLQAWGNRIGRQLRTPLVLALRGDLGAGKSTLARAIAQGAGVEGPIPSPTFNLRFSYNAPRGVQVHHLDLYRLQNAEQVWELGWEELGSDSDLVLIEWPERAEMLLAAERWDVTMEVESPTTRRVQAVRVGTPSDLPPLQ